MVKFSNVVLWLSAIAVLLQVALLVVEGVSLDGLQSLTMGVILCWLCFFSSRLMGAGRHVPED